MHERIAFRPDSERGFCNGNRQVWREGDEPSAQRAGVRDLSGPQGHGSVAHPAGILNHWATITDSGVLVNADGVRFSNEMQGYSEPAPVLRRRKNRRLACQSRVRQATLSDDSEPGQPS